MGTITHLHERLRAVPLRIGAEEDVEVVAADLAKRAVAAVASGLVAEPLAQSGLLAISIPVDFGGLDVSNVVMAEAVGAIAAVSPETGAALARHFSTLEAIRNAGSEEQRRAIFARVASGEWFGGLLAGGSPASEWGLRLSTEGIGYCLDGEIVASEWIVADWLTLSLGNERGEPRFVFVPRHAPEISAMVDDAGIHRLVFRRLHVAADAVLSHSAEARLMSAALGNLLDGAVALGRFRRGVLSSIERLGDLPQDSEENHIRTIKAEIALAYVQMESLAALVNRCGTEIDIAQVTPGTRTIRRASQIATALAIAASRALIQKVDGGIDEEALIELGTDLAKETPYPPPSLETDEAR